MRKFFCAISVIVIVSFIVSPGMANQAKAIDAYNAGNYALAFKYFQALAIKGDPAAQNNLAVMYANGTGVAQNMAAAAKWYTESAEQGLPIAQYNIATLFLDGRGVDQDILSAMVWYQLAAAQGDVLSQLNLGKLYAAGVEMERDVESAYFWLTLALNWTRDAGVRRDAEAAIGKLESDLSRDQIADAKLLAESWFPEG